MAGGLAMGCGTEGDFSPSELQYTSRASPVRSVRFFNFRFRPTKTKPKLIPRRSDYSRVYPVYVRIFNTRVSINNTKATETKLTETFVASYSFQFTYTRILAHVYTIGVRTDGWRAAVNCRIVDPYSPYNRICTRRVCPAIGFFWGFFFVFRSIR